MDEEQAEVVRDFLREWDLEAALAEIVFTILNEGVGQSGLHRMMDRIIKEWEEEGEL